MIGVDTATFKANIAATRERADLALAQYEAAKAELSWWIEGLRLVDPDAAAVEETGAAVSELFPDGTVFGTGSTPTLRQAIVLVMRSHHSISWSVRDIAMALDNAQWLPKSDDASKRISDMASLMVHAGQLLRLGRGVYRLAPQLAAGLEAADRGAPVTDYRLAGRLGFPVPDRLPDEGE